jgi:hypothetical protein
MNMGNNVTENRSNWDGNLILKWILNKEVMKEWAVGKE